MHSNLLLFRLQKPISHAAKEKHKNGCSFLLEEPNCLMSTVTLGLGKLSSSVKETGWDSGAQEKWSTVLFCISMHRRWGLFSQMQHCPEVILLLSELAWFACMSPHWNVAVTAHPGSYMLDSDLQCRPASFEVIIVMYVYIQNWMKCKQLHICVSKEYNVFLYCWYLIGKSGILPWVAQSCWKQY